MKKLTAMVLAVGLTLGMVPMAVSAAGTTVNLLTEEKLTHKVNSDSWSFADGVLNAPNREINDAAYMTDRKIEKGEHVYIEATAKHEGTAWGIIFAEDAADPFAHWFCLNIDGEVCNSRLFNINTASTTGTPYQPQICFTDARDGEYHTLGLEILENGSMKLYLDGVMHTELKDAKFEGATVGLMTCRSNTTFKSFTLTEGAPSGTTAADRTPRKLDYKSTTDLLEAGKLTHTAGRAQFTVENGKLTATRGGGDSAIVSDIFVKPGEHVYIEATAKITDGNAWGIFFTESGVDNPFGNWFCLNASVDVYKSRIFTVNSACNVATPCDLFYFDSSIARNEEITLGLEITADGVFYMTCNGVAFAESKPTTWNGGWLGLMTWESAAEFTSAKLYTVEGLHKDPAPTTPDPTIPEAPKTGSALIPLAVMAVSASVGLAALSVKKRKETL